MIRVPKPWHNDCSINYLIILAVALVAVIIGVAVFREDQILTTLQFALVLTVAAVTVALPTVLSVTMAVGARLVAKKRVIVNKLVAIIFPSKFTGYLVVPIVSIISCSILP
ncbi:hypothetical protein FCL47_12405 [Desulfopila sp. IMCC35006]|nr:hypothetical protein [Desulfopila sp. IMCC35006]TKB25889.1 hypothetical protein FCL47_12405 [Desulfopila sp. IMCC35006]